ncbi:putative ribonuclease H-like domain-containing protein [Tanacetum coccineum]
MVTQSPKVDRKDWNGKMTQKLGLGFGFTKKACFVCGSHNHLIKDCDFHEKRMPKESILGKDTGHREVRPIWNNTQRINHQNKFVPTAVLTRSGRIPVSTAKQYVNTATPKNRVNVSKSKINTFPKSHSPIRRPFYKSTVLNTRVSKEKVNTVRVNGVNTAGQTAVSTVKGNGVTAVKASAGCVWRPKMTDLNNGSKDNSGSWISKRGNPQQALKYKGMFDSGCSRHMTGNKALLTDYQDIDGGFVAFGGSTRGGKITCIVTDDFSRFSWVFFLATKSETSGILNKFITEIENQLNHKVKVIRYDNGTEFKNRGMDEFCGQKGNIVLPELYNKMELLRERIGPLLRVLVTKPHNKTPYELIIGRAPSISFMRPFGCPVTILNTLDPLDKFDGKVEEGFLVGYKSSDDKAKDYTVDDDACRKTVEESANDVRKEFEAQGDSQLLQEKITRDSSTNSFNTVSTLVNTASASRTISPVKPSSGPSFVPFGGSFPIDVANLPHDPLMPELEDTAEIQSTGIFGNAYDDHDLETLNTTYADQSVGAEADFNNMESSTIVSLIPTTRVHSIHPKAQIIGDPKEGKNHKDFQNCLFACFLSQHEATKISQVLDDESWVEAMQKELLQFRIQKVWTLVDLPSGKKAIGRKWVYRNKKDERGIVVKNKVRLVAQGYKQEEGINYDNIFAPVAKVEAIRLFLAFASFMNFPVYQMDVKSAFLYGTIEEELCLPTSRAWYETPSTYLLDNEFHKGQIDKTLFIKRLKDDILLVQVYVDDIIFGSTKKSLCDEFEQIMHNRIGEILKKFFFSSLRTASTPMETNKALTKDEDGEDVDVHLYRGRDTKIPHSGGSPIKFGDEDVHKELGDRMEKATTTASSLKVEQDSELHQLDTFYNALNINDQDSLNSAAGGNFLDINARNVVKISRASPKFVKRELRQLLPKVNKKNQLLRWVSDDDEDIFQSMDPQTTVKPSFKNIEFTKARNEFVKTDKQDDKLLNTRVSKEKVITVRVNDVNTAGQTTVSTVKGNEGNPQQSLKYKGMFDSGCSRHMTENKALLTDYQDIDGGFVAFGGSTIGGRITRIDLTCLFAKATIDESKLWHRRLGHVNFKTMNKLVKGNLVRGLPSKTFENDHTCVACQKGKQYKASLTNDFSRFSWVFFLATKSETSGILKKFITEVENQLNHNVKVIRVLVTKPHNKTPYELIIGRAPSISFMRPFGCPVTILNNLDPLGKFDGKAKEGFLVGYFVHSKAFRVFNTKTRKVKENLHVNFLENKPNVAGQRPNWIFDIDSLTNSMNYQPVTAGNQTNKNAGLQETNGNTGLKKNVDAGQTEEENKSLDDKAKDYTVDDDACRKTVQEPASEYDQALKNVLDKMMDQEKEATEQSDVVRKEFKAQCNNQKKITRASSPNSFNTVSTPVNTASASRTFSPVGPSFVPFGGSFPIDATNLPHDPLMPELEDTAKI